MNLTTNFTLSELTHSDAAVAKGINNNAPVSIVANLEKLCTRVLQPARNTYGKPIKVTSGYRCQELNTLIDGAATSQHCKGQAADLQCADNAQLFNIFRSQNNFDQLIWEFGNDNQPKWIHVSYAEIPRGEVLRCGNVEGKRKYWFI